MVVRLRRWLKAVLQRNFTCLFIDRMLSNQTPLFFAESAVQLIQFLHRELSLTAEENDDELSVERAQFFNYLV